MPKPSTYPQLYNDALQINISKLKEFGYLSNHLKQGTLDWSRNGKPIGSISIDVCINADRPYIELDYKYRDEPRKYKVNLITKPGNLGNGVMWFFVCPNTGKHCRILHSIGGYFLHRTAFKGCMYDSQIQSKKYREMSKLYGAYFKSEVLYEQLYKKYLKKSYAGKSTKKYAKLIEEIAKAERIPIEDIERLLIG